jgi:hypothetical protein
MEGGRLKPSYFHSFMKKCKHFFISFATRTTFAGAKEWFASIHLTNKIGPPKGELILLVGLDGIEPSTKWL